jgi:hypothetical protein
MIKFGDKSKEQDAKAAVGPQPAPSVDEKNGVAQPDAKEPPAASKEEPKK